LISDSLFM